MSNAPTSRTPTVEVDSANNIHMAYQCKSTSGTSAVYYSTNKNGNFEHIKIADLTSSSSLNFTQLRYGNFIDIVLDQNDQVFVVFTDTLTNSDEIASWGKNIHIAQKPASSDSFSIASFSTSEEEKIRYVSLAVDHNSRFHIAYATESNIIPYNSSTKRLGYLTNINSSIEESTIMTENTALNGPHKLRVIGIRINGMPRH